MARSELQEAYDVWNTQFGSDPTKKTTAAERPAIVAGFVRIFELIDGSIAAGRAATRHDLADAARMKDRMLGALLLAALLAVSVAVRLMRRLSRQVLRPISELRTSANQLRDGDLEHRVPVHGAEEIADLAASFNAMADSIALSQQRLALQASQDSLTGLANRTAFQTRLEAAPETDERRAGTQAILFVDLDDFKYVNDSLGHAGGDELLRVVAERLTTAVRPGDLVARLGGDEFAILLDAISHPDIAHAVGERVVTSLAAPVTVLGTEVQIGASVGLALRDERSDVDSITRQADVAMYAAKGRGKNRVERFDPAVHDALMPCRDF